MKFDVLISLLILFYLIPVRADILYQEIGGVVVGEGELYSSRANDASGNGWFVVPGESAGGGTITNARGDSYVQSLPDNGSGGGPLVPPSISYKMQIFTPGTYRLYIRKEGNMDIGSGGNSDSMFMDIVELKDGTAGVFGSATNAIADWYETTAGVDGDFSTTPWSSVCQPEVNQAGAGGYNSDWVIKREGVYTLRFTQREDGAAVDAWVFQLASLPAPTDGGPAVSALTPSRIVIEATGDTYLKRNEPSTAHGGETELALKNDTPETPADLDRTIYLRFDLSPLSAFGEMILTNATLRMDLISEGMGVDHNICVAVIAETATAETFDELTLTPNLSDVWSASVDEGVKFDKVFGGVPVGEFLISTSANGKMVTFDSPGLLEAIRADTDGVLSLVLYRTVDGAATDSFASKEHAALNPPRLVFAFRDKQPGISIVIH